MGLFCGFSYELCPHSSTYLTFEGPPKHTSSSGIGSGKLRMLFVYKLFVKWRWCFQNIRTVTHPRISCSKHSYISCIFKVLPGFVPFEPLWNCSTKSTFFFPGVQNSESQEGDCVSTIRLEDGQEIEAMIRWSIGQFGEKFIVFVMKLWVHGVSPALFPQSCMSWDHFGGLTRFAGNQAPRGFFQGGRTRKCLPDPQDPPGCPLKKMEHKANNNQQYWFWYGHIHMGIDTNIYIYIQMYIYICIYYIYVCVYIPHVQMHTWHAHPKWYSLAVLPGNGQSHEQLPMLRWITHKKHMRSWRWIVRLMP